MHDEKTLTLFKKRMRVVLASSAFWHTSRHSVIESSCADVSTRQDSSPGREHTSLFTFGSSSSVRLNASGARKMMAWTSSKYGIQCCRYGPSSVSQDEVERMEARTTLRLPPTS